MIYGNKFYRYNIINEKVSEEDKKKDYERFIELGKSLLKNYFKELDEYIKYYKKVYELEKTINDKNYKQVIDRIYKMSTSYEKAIGNKYSKSDDFHEFYKLYNKYHTIFTNFKSFYNESFNNQNKVYFKNELKNVNKITVEIDSLVKDAVNEAYDKAKKYKVVMKYCPYQNEIDDDELEFNATAEIMEALYHETLQSVESTMRHLINNLMKNLGEKVDAFNVDVNIHEETQPVKPVEKTNPTNNQNNTPNNPGKSSDNKGGGFAQDLQDSINKIKDKDEKEKQS